jgi:hypothetical protein
MGANTIYYVKVITEKEEWRIISAVVSSEAIVEAATEPGVVRVIEAQRDEPADLYDWGWVS